MVSDRQEAAWERLYADISRTLARFGREDAFGQADYVLVDDNWGNYQHKVEIQNLALLRPHVVAALQGLLHDRLDWEIVIGVGAPVQQADWPPMGLTIRSHEIVDGLQRQHLPPEFQDLNYAGSRPGTDRD